MKGINVLNKMMGQIDINVAQLGQIVNYDQYDRLADVKLLSDPQGLGSPLLISVPVATHIVEPLIGDTVVVLFLDYDSDDILLGGGTGKPNSNRTHDLSDGVVVARIKTLGGGGR